MSSVQTKTALQNMQWQWGQIKPYFQELLSWNLTSATVVEWLAGWTRLKEFLNETYWRLYVAITVDTSDQIAQEQYHIFLDETFPLAQSADYRLKRKLLESGVIPMGLDVPLRNVRAEVELHSEANIPLLAEEIKLSAIYDQIIGAQTVYWQGKELTLTQLFLLQQSQDRAVREEAWRAAAARQLADREAINELWVKLMEVRGKLAANLKLPDYRAYRWKQLLRHDFTPQDCYHFHRSIANVAVPAAWRIDEKRRRQLGLDSLRPWDLEVDPLNRPPLRPFRTTAELVEKTTRVFEFIDPQLASYFKIMQQEGLLDLENRKNKAPGGYCTEFQTVRRPFIFMNCVGIHDDVLTLLHEGGHSFHVFETAHLPYAIQLQIPVEFMEMAATTMEYIGDWYYETDFAGFYSPVEAARAREEHLKRDIRFLPYMAVVDAFQHWAYRNHHEASKPANCDATWAKLWKRYMIGEDWSGLDDEMVTGWQRRLHLIQSPFYYVDYGLAQIGATQVWRNALKDQAGAIAAYRRALSLGGTVTLPQLFAAAGGRLGFDTATLRQSVSLMEDTLDWLSTIR